MPGFPSPANLGVLISGRGSNLQALIDAIASGHLDASIALVISNVAGAGGLDRARSAGIETAVVDHRGWPSRDDYDRALGDELRSRDVELVCLAGFMRRIGAPLIQVFPGAIVNIHPSLLPLHKGLDTHARVLAAGDAQHGVSVHFVTPELDGGPVIAQAAVPVLPGDDAAALSARVHAREHILYPMVIEWLTQGRLQWNHGAPALDGKPLAAPVLLH